MTRDRRLLVLLILLMAYGLFAAEARYHTHEAEAAVDARHRHRHRHETNGRRNRHELIERRPGWSGDVEYEDDSSSLGADREEDDEEEDDDYDARPYYARSYPSRGRMLDPRYPPPRHHRGGYRGWYEAQVRRGSPRYEQGYNRPRISEKTHRRPAHARNRDADYEDTEVDEFDYEKMSRWDNGRKHRPAGAYRLHDWRTDGRKRHRDDWRGRSNLTDSRFHSRNDRRRAEDLEDYYEYLLDELDEDDEFWNEDQDDEEFDNDFYKDKRKPPLKTYDDIIRRLTSNEPAAAAATTVVKTSQGKRDYRNIEADRHPKRDALGNFKYEPRNLTRPLPVHDVSKTEHRAAASKLVENLAGKLSGSLLERKSARNVSQATRSVERKADARIDDAQPKTKSLEQDYDEYLNAPDNEKEEDLIKAGVEEETGNMQADVTNTDFEDEDEEETPAATTTSTTTTTTTSTTTTTTTPKPAVTQNYDYRDSRAYEGGTGPQYNGYQSKNEYPPMSAHSVHKWQSLGTRESVKETRSNMQQYNKNGKSAEIREALQHAIKVSREGSCQWPRPRVIPVRDVYPSPSTTYIPHCVILHRCSDDTGCCRSEALTCVPKHSHRVELSFYTTNVGGSSVVEKLSFYNHTECECRERTEYDTGNERPSEHRVYRHHQSAQPQNMRRAQTRKPCRCPSEFTPRITSEGECHCNCLEDRQNCIKIRRGKGYFSLADRICIQNEECATPGCEFGEYMRRQGKCPRKKDKFDAIANYHTNLNHRYRS